MSVFPVFAWKAQTYRVQNISVSVLMIMMRAGKFLPTPRKRNTPYCDCEFRTEKEKKRLVYWKKKKTKGKKKRRKKQNWKTSHYHILLISLKAGFYNCAWGFPNETSIVSLKVSPNFCWYTNCLFFYIWWKCQSSQLIAITENSLWLG